MQNSYGYFGRILWVDLSKGIGKEEPLPDEVYQEYLGGYAPGTKNMPRWLANGLAPLVEIFWRLFRLHGEPPLSREILAFFFNPVSINDDKARRELGYRGRITTKQGLAELRKQNIQRPPV